MIRTTFLSRPALAVALALGTVAGAGLVATPALAAKKEKAPAAPKISPTKTFVPAYAALKTSSEAAAKRQDVIDAKAAVQAAEQASRSARGAAARKAAADDLAAKSAALGALLTTEKAQLEDAYAKVGNADDKFLAGQLALNLGNVAVDKALQRRGLISMVESGKLPPEDTAKYNYYIGGLAFDLKDYAGAVSALQAAIAGGFADPTAKAVLAEAQNSSGQTPAALATLKGLVEATKAAGQPVQPDWLDRGVQWAYNNKLAAESMEWATLRLENDPSQFNWISAGQIVREKLNLGSNDSIDVSRVLDRAGALKVSSQSATREYIEYIQSAVGKAGVLYPGEVVKVASKGIAVGALQKTDPFVNDALTEANRRLAADKASLAGLERDARAPAATAKTASIAADTFLSYDDFAKAEALYAIALGKPGVDADSAQLRLGIAQLGQGKTAEAKASFEKVAGVRKPLARLWWALADGKAIPAE